MDLRGIYSIPRGVPFLSALAQGLLAAAPNPMALAAVRVLLPNRRSVRSLREAFLAETNGRAMLLPRMVALGDVDADADLHIATLLAPGAMDIPPPVSATERLVQLSRFVQARDTNITAAQALAMARNLGTLLNELTLYNITPAQLAALPPEDMAEHWQQTRRFLEILVGAWPQYLQQIGRSDPAMYRAECLQRLAAAWLVNPPPYPVVMAGTARAEPPVMDVARTVATHGAVVLPAFDMNLMDDEWLQLDTVHPDSLLREVMDGLGVARSHIQTWPYDKAKHHLPAARLAWLGTAMQPAALTASWYRQADMVATDVTDNIDYIECVDEAAEAQTIALLIRKELETPARTIALVTPDRALARRVAALLRRWGVRADDSSGQPFTLSPLGVYLQLVSQAAAPTATVHDVLALLKHPLCGLGIAPGHKSGLLARFELQCLRGQFPAPGLSALLSHIQGIGKADNIIMQVLQAHLLPFAHLMNGETDAGALLAAHMLAAEQMAATADEQGAERLWLGEAAESASGALAELRAALAVAYPLTGDDYMPWLAQMLAGVAVRVPYGQHPRVAIHGLIEARLQQADVIIVAGLNEGVWPSLPAANPWLNNSMRRALGLPDAEAHVTQQAHDFISAAAAARVYLTRAARQNNVPTVPARWLMRLQAVLAPSQPDGLWAARGQQYADMAAMLDKPAVPPAPPSPPAYAPPAEHRPAIMNVSDVSLLMRNPYGYYARRILNLRELDELADEPTAALRGTLVHDVLRDFYQAVGDRALQPSDRALFIDIADRHLQPLAGVPGLLALWQPWLHDIAAWVWDHEHEIRPARRPLAVEGDGQRVWHGWGTAADGGSFTLRARADRIDDAGDDGVVIVDYKTGVVPAPKDQKQGLDAQLALEALIANANGFGFAGAGRNLSAEYWEIRSTYNRCGIKKATIDIDATEQGLQRLVRTYADAAQPYKARPVARHDAYKHLARTKEWSYGAADDDTDADTGGDA